MAVDKGQILRLVLTELAAEGFRYAPVGVSVKHVHLSEKDLHSLFGPGYELHPLRDLVQPGQYAAKEQVTLVGPKGKLEKIRVIGPARNTTQIELGITDAMAIGMKNVPVRLSGDLAGTPGIQIQGPSGAIETDSGTIIAARHLHVSKEEALAFGLHDGMVVSIRTGGVRSGILENVICRVGKGHELEFHVDTDEANACGLQNGDIVEILLPGQSSLSEQECENKFDAVKIAERVIRRLKGITDNNDQNLVAHKANVARTFSKESQETLLDLVTERDINDAIEKGDKAVYCCRKALITPAAADRALAFGIDIVKSDGQAEVNIRPESGQEILELVTAGDLNIAFRDDKKEIYCTRTAIITPSAKERIAETGIKVIRVGEG